MNLSGYLSRVENEWVEEQEKRWEEEGDGPLEK
jgi:hypothetical protein